MATQSIARPTPEHIFNTLTAFQQTAALKAAIALDVFTKIGEGANQPAAIAKSIGAAERGVRILCDYLTIQGFLKKENGRYALSPDSAMFLHRRSPAWMGSIADFIADPEHYHNFGLLADAVRKGGTATQKGDHTKAHEDLWVKFAEAMAPMTLPASMFICKLIDAASGKAMNVLDIAAGHGMYGITVARQNPNARVTAVDWPAVLEVAKKNAEKAGVANRYITQPGSAFEADLGTGYDCALLTNILHHFDRATCEKLLKRVHGALKPGGKAVVLEFVPNEDRVTPPTAAAFAIVMLAGTDSGDAYTFAEYEKMLRDCGFAKATLHPMQDMPQQVIVAEK